MTGIHLYQDRLIVRSLSGTSPVTNASLNAAASTVSAATDIPEILSSANSGGIVVASAKELFVWTGSVYLPGSAVSTHDIDIEGAINYESNNVSVSGSWESTQGTVTGNGLISFTALTSETIDASGSSLSSVLFVRTGTWTLSSNLSVSGSLTLSGGTLEQSTATLSVSDDMRIAAGSVFTKSSNASALTLNGTLILEDEVQSALGQLHIASGSYTVSASGSLVLDRLVVGTGSTFVLNNANLAIGTGGLALHGHLNASGASTIALSCSWIASGLGDFAGLSSTVTFNATAGSHTISSSGAFADLIMNGFGSVYSAS